MMFVAAATMLFVSCGKDNLDPENNQLRYDGTIYNMQSTAMCDAMGYIDFTSVGQDADFTIYGVFDNNALNRTYNLAVATEGVHYNIDFISEALALNFSYDNNDGAFYGGMEGVQRGESIFSKGTCTVTNDNDGFLVTLDGTLKNGKEMAFKAYVPKAQIQTMQ